MLTTAKGRSRMRTGMLAGVPSMFLFISIFVTLYVKRSLQTSVPSLGHLAMTTMVLVAPNLAAVLWSLWMVHVNWTAPAEILKGARFIYISIVITAFITSTLLYSQGFGFEEVIKQTVSSVLDFVVFRFIIFGSIYKKMNYMKVEVL